MKTHPNPQWYRGDFFLSWGTVGKVVGLRSLFGSPHWCVFVGTVVFASKRESQDGLEMPCAACGQWAQAPRWFAEYRLEGPNEDWRWWTRDPVQQHLYHYLKCTPSCKANALHSRLWVLERDLLQLDVSRRERDIVVRLLAELRDDLERLFAEVTVIYAMLDQ